MVAVLLTQHPARTTPTRLSSILDVSPRLRRVLGTPVELVLHAADFSGSIEKAQALLEVLEQREITVSAVVRKRILATRDELALQRWIERAITVTRVAERFEPPGRGRSRSEASVQRPAPMRATRRPARSRVASGPRAKTG